MAHSFRKIFLIGQNLKHVYMAYSFLEILINSWYLMFEVSEAVVREAAVQWCSKDALKNFENLQENTCDRVSFPIKLQTLCLQLYWKRDSVTVVFRWILQKDLWRLLLKIISHHTKEILYTNTNFMGNQPWSKNKHFLLLLILMLKKPVF